MGRRPWVALVLALVAVAVSGAPGRIRPVAAADPYILESIATYRIRAEQREIGVRVAARVHEHHAGSTRALQRLR